DWGEISRVTNDLSSIALDGLALAYYRRGDPLNAASALEDVITHAPGDGLWWSDDSRLVGWIGWLYFDAAVYDKAAEYMQECWDRMPQYIDRESSSETTNEFIAFTEWYIYYGSQPNNSDIHA